MFAKSTAALFVVTAAFCLQSAGAWAQSPEATQESAEQDRLAQLRSDNRQAVLTVIYDLRDPDEISEPKLLAELIRLASGDDAGIQEAVCGRLKLAGPKAKSALPTLESLLGDESIEVRLAAANADWIVRGSVEKSAPVLVAVLRDSASTKSRYYARSVLKRMGAKADRFSNDIKALLTDTRTDVRAFAAEILGEYGPDHRQELEAVLTARLSDDSPRVQIAAAAALHRIHAPLEAAVAELIKIAEDEPEASDRNRNSLMVGAGAAGVALKTMQEIGPDAAAATPVLIEKLKSPILAIRLDASEALVKIGPAAKAAIPALGEALRETEGHAIPFVHRAFCVGKNAANALVRIGPESAPTLVDALKDKDPIVRANSVRGLSDLPYDPTNLNAIIGRLDDEHPAVRIEAAKALARFGQEARTAAAPLTKLLFDDRAVTSFRGGMGLGDTESVRAEALEAIVTIRPTAEQVVPAWLDGLKATADVPFEALFILRKFADDAKLVVAPLKQLQKADKSSLGAAAGLAVLAPAHPELEQMLRQRVVLPRSDDSEQVQTDPIALFGLGELAAGGVSLQKETRDLLRTLANEDLEPFIASTLFKLAPNDDRAAEDLIKAWSTAHTTFEAAGIREAKRTLLAAAAQPNVRQQLVRLLHFEPPNNKNLDDYSRRQLRRWRRMKSAQLLAQAGEEEAAVIQCLIELAEDNEVVTNGSTADILSGLPDARETSLPMLGAILSDRRLYIVGGDFYGNGGDRRIAGDRAAQALVKLGAYDVLTARLNDVDPLVRQRVIRTLGGCGLMGLSDSLLNAHSDQDYRVRRELMLALGKIGAASPNTRQRVRPILNNGLEDERRSVRDAAQQALARLQ